MYNKNKIIILSIALLFLSPNLYLTSAVGNSDENKNLNFLNQQSDSEKHAVIMVGRYFGLLSQMVNRNAIQNYYTNYLRDAGKMYTTLRDTCGYFEENIYLLVKELPTLFLLKELPVLCLLNLSPLNFINTFLISGRSFFFKGRSG